MYIKKENKQYQYSPPISPPKKEKSHVNHLTNKVFAPRTGAQLWALGIFKATF